MLNLSYTIPVRTACACIPLFFKQGSREFIGSRLQAAPTLIMICFLLITGRTNRMLKLYNPRVGHDSTEFAEVRADPVTHDMKRSIEGQAKRDF